MVTVQVAQNSKLFAIVIETPQSADYLRVGNSVDLCFKETEVIIAKESGYLLSIRNSIPGKIVDIKRGELFCRVEINTAIGSINAVVPTMSVDHLSLNVDLEIVALVKVNEIMLAE